MKRLRIGFLVSSRFAQSTGLVPVVMRALSDAGVVVDVIHPTQGALELSDVRVEHDLYFLKKVSRLSLSLAGALHAQGAAIVNPYPVSVALRDKIVTTRILQLAGVPIPASYVAAQPDRFAPLLNQGPLVLKPYHGSDGIGVRVVRSVAELAAVPAGRDPMFAQRRHAGAPATCSSSPRAARSAAASRYEARCCGASGTPPHPGMLHMSTT